MLQSPLIERDGCSDAIQTYPVLLMRCMAEGFVPRCHNPKNEYRNLAASANPKMIVFVVHRKLHL